MPARAVAQRIERGIAAAERALIVILLAVMALSVFLDALHRIFAAEEGRTLRLLLALTPDGAHAAVRAVLAPALLVLLTFAITYAALAARAAGVPGAAVWARRWRVLHAALITAALAGGTQLLLVLLPHGLVFSQQMSLCFMLWVALAGASLGARDRSHIAFELAGKLWPGPLRRPAERLARVLAAGFTALLALLAASHTRGHYLEWATSDGTAGLFEAFRVPRFLIYGFLPVPLAILALRFVVFGVRADDEPEERPA